MINFLKLTPLLERIPKIPRSFMGYARGLLLRSPTGRRGEILLKT